MYSRFSVFSLSLLPGSSYFTKWHPLIFPSQFPASALTHCMPCIFRHLPEWHLQPRPFSDLHRNCLHNVSQLTCPDFFAEREPKLSEAKSCSSDVLSCMDSPGCALLSVIYAQNRRMYITCNIYCERLECFKLLVPLKTPLFKYCMQADVSK